MATGATPATGLVKVILETTGLAYRVKALADVGSENMLCRSIQVSDSLGTLRVAAWTRLSLCWSVNQENTMIKSGLIGTMAFSLMFALAATAMGSDVQDARVHHYKRHANAAPPSALAYGDANLPVENALRW